ncbi:MAG: tetratricopeptide repeat protein [Gammaproteobacteria bacterium]|nr:tetratricopeptide repeat protein [Gammaproteobacteria bacterium]
MKRPFALIAILAALLAAAPVQALQLGGLRVESHLGEPLRASIDVLVGSRDALAGAEVTVLPDITDRRSAPLAATIGARVVPVADGSAYIVLNSSAPIVEPAFSVRVRLAHDGMAQSRSYAVLVDPLPARRSSRARTATTAVPDTRATTTSAEHYGPVRPNETLWSIARRVRGEPTLSLGRVVEALHGANPQAFIDGDADRLKVGVTLAVPAFVAGTAHATSTRESATTRSIAVVETRQSGVRPAADVAPAQAVQPLAAQPDAAPAPAADVMPAQTVMPAQAVMSAPATAPSPVHVAEIAAIDARLAELRTFVAARSDRSVATIPVPDAARAVPPRKAPGTAMAPTAVTSVPAASPRIVAGRDLTIPWLLLAIAVPLTLLLGYAARHYRRGRTVVVEERTRRSDDQERVAALAEKVASRQAVFDRNANVLPMKRRSSAARIEHRAEPPLRPHNPFAEIDLNLAYGQYLQAEQALRRVIAASGHNHQAKLKLAEVYYVSGQRDHFVEVAEDLQRRHRDILDDEDWERLREMGRAIAPMHPLFGGPTLVDRGDRTGA